MRDEDSHELREEDKQHSYENQRNLRILRNAAKHAHDPDYIGPEDEEDGPNN